MPRTNSNTRIVVLAKTPRPGTVKTRLAPLLGEAGAAALHARLVERTLATACAANLGPVELCCAPHADDPFFSDCGSRFPIALTSQTEGDLGARMLAAFTRTMPDAGSSVILIGTDCPALAASHLGETARALSDGNDAVLIPAEDGGYALLGLTRCDPLLFDGVAWGTDQVMAQTRERLRRLDWRWRELPPLWDVDRPRDYQRLLASGLLAPEP